MIRLFFPGCQKRLLVLSVVSVFIRTYNVLADIFCDGYWRNGRWIRRPTIPKCVQWDERWPLILRDLVVGCPDIICLQEVEPRHFESHFQPALEQEGYTCLLQKKNKFANATCFLRANWRVSWRSDRSRILMLQLEHLRIAPPLRIYVSNAHLEGHPLRPHLRLRQIMSAFKQLRRHPDHEFCPIFIIGDFNESDEDGIYELLSEGTLSPTSSYRDSGVSYTQTEVSLPDGLSFSSSYLKAFGHEPQATFWGNESPSCIDFIFYCSGKNLGEGIDSLDDLDVEEVEALDGRIRLSAVMKIRDEGDRESIRTLPNHRYGSDHLSLFARYDVVGSCGEEEEEGEEEEDGEDV